VRVLHPQHQPTLLQLVDDGDEPARKHAEPFGNLLLARPRGGSDDTQRPYVCWSQSKGGQPLGKLCGRMSSHLSQQESR
jgi:hypothetical protein